MWIGPGLIVAILNGAMMPLFGFLLGNVLGILSQFDLFNDPTYDGDKSDILWENDKYVIGFFILAVASFFIYFF